MSAFDRGIAIIATVGFLSSMPMLLAHADQRAGERTEAAPMSAEAPPPWAYPWDPSFPLPPATDTPHRVPGSDATYSVAQSRDLFVAPDWHPANRPPMPDVVARGRKPEVRACGSCHRVEGSGGPENANLAGLPADYIIRQMADYKSGARKFSGPARGPITLMVATAKAATDAEVREAADYFSKLAPRKHIDVIEAETIPKVQVARAFFVRSGEGGTEPLGRRIVETPVNVEQFELRDSRATFVAYVPVGSIAKGELLARTGGDGRTTTCTSCHGADFRGVGPVPRLAGRSPTYAVRQLYDFKHGARAGGDSARMQPVVEKLSLDDMIALAAFFASLDP